MTEMGRKYLILAIVVVVIVAGAFVAVRVTENIAAKAKQSRTRRAPGATNPVPVRYPASQPKLP